MSKPATIIRAKHDRNNPYFQMHRDTAQDKELSWEARGMLCYLLSQSDTWEIQVKDLQQNCGQGRVYRILDELKAAGYIKDREKKQNPDTGRWEWTPYVLFERPQPDNVIHVTETMSRKPQHGKPDMENDEIVINTKEENKKNRGEAQAPPPDQPTQEPDNSVRSQVIELGVLATASQFESFNADLDEYTTEQWLSAIETFKQRRKEKSEYLPYKYLVGILRGLEAEAKQAEVVKPKTKTIYTVTTPDHNPILDDLKAIIEKEGA